MPDPIMDAIIRRAADEKAAASPTKLTPLEQARINAKKADEALDRARQQAMSRAIITGEPTMPKDLSLPAPKHTTPVPKTVEMSRGRMEEIGWWDVQKRASRMVGSSLDMLDEMEAYGVAGDAIRAAKQVMALKGDRTTRITREEYNHIVNFIGQINGVCEGHERLEAAENEKAEQEKRRAERQAELDAQEAERKVREMRFATVDFEGEHGTIYINGTTLKLCVASVERGVPLLLIGEPGSGKTDIARSIPALADRRVFHLDVTGLSDVAQIEAERYIENVGGVSVTVSKPTPLIEALEAAETGEKVCLVIDEIARTVDPSILNPLLLLLSHGEYHATVGKKVYRVNRDNFTVIATANIDAGRNFSGNNRRGLDDALVDRFRIIRIPRAGADHIPAIIAGRVPGLDAFNVPSIGGNMLAALQFLYQSAVTPEQRRIITTRSIIGVADAWVSLDPRLYSLAEIVKLELQDRTADESTLSGLITLLEQKGF